jgi:hypothetical protein
MSILQKSDNCPFPSFRRKSFDAALDHELVEWPESSKFRDFRIPVSTGMTTFGTFAKGSKAKALNTI